MLFCHIFDVQESIPRRKKAHRVPVPSQELIAHQDQLLERGIQAEILYDCKKRSHYIVYRLPSDKGVLGCQ